MAGGRTVTWQCGRPFTAGELSQIREVAGLFPRLSLMELLSTICEQLEWRTASGGHKRDACRKLLEKMEARGELVLPVVRAKRASRRRGARAELVTPAPAEPMVGDLEVYRPVQS